MTKEPIPGYNRVGLSSRYKDNGTLQHMYMYRDGLRRKRQEVDIRRTDVWTAK